MEQINNRHCLIVEPNPEWISGGQRVVNEDVVVAQDGHTDSFHQKNFLFVRMSGVQRRVHSESFEATIISVVLATDDKERWDMALCIFDRKCKI